jgi:hypothetical protein
MGACGVKGFEEYLRKFELDPIPLKASPTAFTAFRAIPSRPRALEGF